MNSSNNSVHDTISFLVFNPLLSSLGCDHYHHYYHYQASAQYLWLAETLRALGLTEEAGSAYDKAIFQDHLNAEAIERKKNIGDKEPAFYVPVYDKHVLSDEEFRKSVGLNISAATAAHDEGIKAYLAGDPEKAFVCFDQAIAADTGHSNSYFARGRYWFDKHQYEKARADFEEAIRLSHLAHESYHHLASEEHLARGKRFLGENEFDLAITDCTKALDLWRTNKQALGTRAKAYRAKGSIKLAEEDEESATLLS